MIANPVHASPPQTRPTDVEAGFFALLREISGLPFDQSLRLSAVMTDHPLAQARKFSVIASFLLAELRSEDNTPLTKEYVRRQLLKATFGVVRLEQHGESFLDCEIEDVAESDDDVESPDYQLDNGLAYTSALHRDPDMVESPWHEPFKAISPTRRQLMVYLMGFLGLPRKDTAKAFRCTDNVVYQNFNRGKSQITKVAAAMDEFRNAAAAKQHPDTAERSPR